jgi:formylglycine-generating enzyme required for sulfatase activity
MMTAGLVALCSVAQAGLVTIGNAGNAADTADGDFFAAGIQNYGAVAYTYQIMLTEVTIAEFTASGAGNGNENYWNDGTRTVGPNAPAVYVSLYEAMKYCNWLTSGNVNNGYYSTPDGGTTYQANALNHDAYAAANGLTYFLPTEDEWYKAAYFKPDGSGYSLYANGTANIPTHGTTDGWNYDNNGYVNSAPNYIWVAGFGGVEQNGTYDMMGNVVEWTEEASGVLRAASYSFDEFYQRSSFRGKGGPGDEDANAGFRIAVIPEPGISMLLAIGGGIAWLVRKKQRR